MRSAIDTDAMHLPEDRGGPQSNEDRGGPQSFADPETDDEDRGLAALRRHVGAGDTRALPRLAPGEVYGFQADPQVGPGPWLARFDPEGLRSGLDALTDFCHGASVAAGWWHTENGDPITAPVNVPVKLMLIVSEVSEAMEADRKGQMDDKIAYRPGIEVELADALIRILDLAGALGLDLPGAFIDKMEFNSRRADHKPEARRQAGGKTY